MSSQRYAGILTTVTLCITFFIISVCRTNSFFKGVSDDNVVLIEKTLHELQMDGRETVLRAVSSCPRDVVPNFDSIDCSELYRKGVFIFVVDTVTSNVDNPANRILYWSDNIPVTVEQLDNISDAPKYIYLGNAWYVGQSFHCGRFSCITLILIAREYIYQNQFLRNETNPIFNFHQDIVILPLGEVGIPVKDRTGVPLFVVNSSVPSIVTSGVSLLFRWLTVIAACCLIMFIFHNAALYRRSVWYLLPAFALLSGLRMFVLYYSSLFKGDMYLFAPSLYADSEFLPSLGDLLLHHVFLFLFVTILFSAKKPLRAILRRRSMVLVIFDVLIALLLRWIQYTVESLTFNSEISFNIYKMNDVTVFTFLAYFILVLVFAQLCLLIYLHIYVSGYSAQGKRFVQHCIVVLSTLGFLMTFRCETMIIFALYAVIYFLYMKKAYLGLSFSMFVWQTMFISLYVSFSLITNTTEKEHKQREVLATGLLAESDPVAEMLLKEMEHKISSDVYIKKLLCSGLKPETDLYTVLGDKYFRGYFHRYELIYHVCRPDMILHIPEEGKSENCIDFFMNEKSEGRPLSGSSHFLIMNNYRGRIHYLGDFMFVDRHDTAYLFLELYLKREVESLVGYPELLKLESGGINYEARGYSYAKYFDRKLVGKVGAYDYSFEWTSRYRDGFFERNGYSHYSFKTKDGNVAILSYPKLGYSGIVSMFSYSFVIFIVLLYFLLTVAGLKIEVSISKNSYRRKITLVMLVGIIGALTALTVAMLTYIISQSEKKNLDTVHSKMQSTIIELDQSLFDSETISSETLNTLEATLVLLSNAFKTDLNMYDMSGNLIVSSRNEIFDRHLIGKKMNREAFHVLATDKQSTYVHTERIGTISCYSSYTTYHNYLGEAIAYLNILHFDNRSEFRSELLSLTGAITNIYIFLIIIGVALSLFVSNQITRPLDLVSRKMARLNFTERLEPIDYKENNELGDLVRAYNRMIEKLAESAKILAENERESAWREMARQIAHEIKNPLTPMKLNIQLALRMKNENRTGWQEKMDSAIQSTLEQIDILSYIASEFSDFAHTGTVKLEPVDLSQTVASVVSLFSAYRDVQINCDVESKKDYRVKANKEQLHRVLTNLLKNSIQAVEKVPNPVITLVLQQIGKTCVLRISDNGAGISDDVVKNLFRPYFTTKSGGTGLGLAISKSIIESFGGTIVFCPDERGTCFEITLPVG
jgi:signal transduction histidine kinase